MTRFQLLTFDIIGDLEFGEPFGCLETLDYHPWVKLIFDSIRFVSFSYALAYYPSIHRIVPYIIPNALAAKAGPHNLSDEELFGNSSTLIVPSSETTATVLSSVTWLLLRNPEIMSELVSEIRSSFSDVSEINFTSVRQLKYLLACLNEAMRLFPPAPTGLARIVPKGGDMIDGRWDAGGVCKSPCLPRIA